MGFKTSKNKRSIKRIIYFITSPFNGRDYERYGVEIIRKNGFIVEVWDFSPFLSSEHSQEPSDSSRDIFEGYRTFLCMKDAISQIRKLEDDCFVVVLVSYIYESYPIFRALAKKRLPYCLQVYKFPSRDLNSGNGFIRKIKSLSLKKVANILFNKYLPYWVMGISPAKIFLNLGGQMDLNKSRLPISRNTSIVFSHYFDYDIYMKEREKSALCDENTCVFLDTFLPFHPASGSTPIIDPEKYFPQLRSFFDFLEEKYKVKIVIAAHPRSDYQARPDYFGGREVVKGKTAELVRNSHIVISHESAAVSFAVLFEKPVIFITNNILKEQSTGGLIDFMALLLGKQPINLDHDFIIDWDKEMSVNKKAYRDYRNEYIKKDGTEEVPIWQNFVDSLKKEYHN
jgi:hypothetical protein